MQSIFTFPYLDLQKLLPYCCRYLRFLRLPNPFRLCFVRFLLLLLRLLNLLTDRRPQDLLGLRWFLPLGYPGFHGLFLRFRLRLVLLRRPGCLGFLGPYLRLRLRLVLLRRPGCLGFLGPYLRLRPRLVLRRRPGCLSFLGLYFLDPDPYLVLDQRPALDLHFALGRNLLLAQYLALGQNLVPAQNLPLAQHPVLDPHLALGRNL